MAMVVLATFVLLGAATLIGIGPVRKLIEMREARHELRQGSANYLRGLAGWSVVGFWILATWYFATILGDWGVTGDLDGAIARSWLRLRVILEIALAIAESD